VLPQEQEMEENALSHVSSFSSRNWKQGPKRKETEENRNSLKENATKLH